MTHTMPEVGACVRLTRTHKETGTTATVEGVVDLVREDMISFGCETEIWELDHYDSEWWTVTIDVLAPPLPPEPGRGTTGHAVADATTVWLRGFGGWFDGFSDDRGEGAFLTWAQLYRRSPKVQPLFRAPLLAEVVEALRETAPAWHERECGDMNDGPDLDRCTRTECVEWRALLAKVTGEVAA